MPIINGKVVLSYSAYSTYLKCPLSYKFEKIDRVKSPIEDNTFTVPGSIIHNLSEEWLNTRNDKLFSKDNILEKVEKYSRRPDVNLVKGYGSYDKATKFILDCANNLFRFILEKSYSNNPLTTEYWFGTSKNPLQLTDNLYTQGAGDLMEDLKNGSSILYDYKATWATKNLNPDQLLLYKIAYEKVLNKKISMGCFFLIPSNKVVSYTFTDEDSKNLIQRMDTAAKNISEGNFKATPSERVCKYCKYKDMCGQSFCPTPKEEKKSSSMSFSFVEL